MNTNNNTSKPTRYKLWAFGSNGSGQLGIGHQEDVSLPQECKGEIPLPSSGIRQLAAGGNHTVAIFNDGTFASTGDNADGRGIVPNTKHIHTTWQQQQQQQEGLAGEKQEDFVRHVAATWSATTVCDAEANLRVAGTGSSGELGKGSDISVAEVATPMNNFLLPGDSIVKIASGMGHVVVVSESGEAWGWGKGRKGQLGGPAENVQRPRKIEDVPFKVVNAVCGKDFTCLFGDASSGEFLILGLAGSDRFGVKKNAPDSVRGWKQVAASWGSIYVLMESGELRSWGRNDHGQLSPPGLPLLSAVAAGSEHCLGLTQDGRVLAWGWGEHGNCGMHIDDNGDVKGRWNTVAMSQPATNIFAGCATSFVITSEALEPQ